MSILFISMHMADMVVLGLEPTCNLPWLGWPLGCVTET